MDHFDNIYSFVPYELRSTFNHQKKLGFLTSLQNELELIRDQIFEKNKKRTEKSSECSCGCNSLGSGDANVDPVENILASRSTLGIEPSSTGKFETFFWADMSSVRIHIGPAASRAAKYFGAPAFTVCEQIIFDYGMYRPGTKTGDALIAHELTHVLQQRAGRRDSTLNVAGTFLEDQAIAAENLIGSRSVLGEAISPAPRIVQMANPIIAKCAAICPQVIIDPFNGVPCGLSDCEHLGFFPTVIATSYCIYLCAVNKYAAFIINTRFGPMGPFFTRGTNQN